MKKTSSQYISYAAIIAAMYVILTYLSALLGISSGVIQCRLSEALCVLVFFTPAAVPGLFAGCLAANILTGALLPDIVFGSLATLLGALAARLMSKRTEEPMVLALPTVISNTVIIPLVLKYAYGVQSGLWMLVLSVLLGEVVSAAILGRVFFGAFEKIFKGRL